MTDENKFDVTEKPVKVSKFKRFLQIVFGDMLFKFLAVAGAVLVFLAFTLAFNI